MKANDFRDLSDEELSHKEADLREDLFKLKYQHTSGQLENKARIKLVKKDIARLLTVYRERIQAKIGQS
ncbi:MAG: 50S ribosomal protein L29 [bacterium]